MNNISFFTPVCYNEKEKTILHQIQEGIDDYFYLGGKIAYVIPGKVTAESQAVTLKDKSKVNVFLSAIKVISYCLPFIPLLMLAFKFIYRATNKFHAYTPINKSANNQDNASPVKSQASRINSLNNSLVPRPTNDPAQINSNNNNSSTINKIVNPNAPAVPSGKVASLMDRYTKAWNKNTGDFDFSKTPFDLNYFTELISDHAKRFTKKDVNNEQHFGYIEKFDLDPAQNPKIYMRADLHGDLKSLIENLRSLQDQGLMDENFKCKPGVHLVFLGDYCDRGLHGTQILEMLMRLREENPDQIHLIRGNHEYAEINGHFGATDKRLMATIHDQKAQKALESFYQTMSLTTYFSVDNGESREYVQCTHGLFELAMDPAPLLDQKSSGDYIPVPKKRELSERIRKIAEGNSELAQAAKRVQQLVQQDNCFRPDLTAYNWADISSEETNLGDMGAREYALNARDIRHYLDVSSEKHKVQMIFRGHQHEFQHMKHNGQVIVTTLPVGMDCPAYQGRWDQPDIAYIINPKDKVAKWEKRAILRETNKPVTDAVTSAHYLTSSAI